MSFPRFFLEDATGLKPGSTVELSEQEGSHLKTVLRIKPEETVELVNGNGFLASARVSGFTKRSVLLYITSVAQMEDDRLPVTLIVSMLKAERMDWLVEKATELGPLAILPVITERSVRPSHNTREMSRLKRWSAIACQTLKQCKGVYLPLIDHPIPLTDAVKKTLGCKGFMLNEMEKKSFLNSSCVTSGSSSMFSLCIGPEGAFTPQESRMLLEAEFESVSLGRRILRAETAAIAALGVMSSILNATRTLF